MKVLCNRPGPDLLRGVAQLLVETLALPGREVWLISPWVRDVRLPLADAGHFASLLGGARDEIGLVEMMAALARRHTLHVVLKPPGELVDLGAARRLALKLDARGRLASEEYLQGLTILEELTADLDTDIRDLARQVTAHAETIEAGWRMQEGGARLYYLDKLHAKLLWTPLGALVGSANFTNGGLSANEEVMLEVTDRDTHAALGETARQLGGRAQPAGSYTLRRALERVGYEADDFLRLAGRPGLAEFPEVRRLLERLAPSARGA
jgi:phosphatidylserine/phosphatidylglycerophosphate/cardiolipin synthase-like enzyme